MSIFFEVVCRKFSERFSRDNVVFASYVRIFMAEMFLNCFIVLHYCKLVKNRRKLHTRNLSKKRTITNGGLVLVAIVCQDFAHARLILFILFSYDIKLETGIYHKTKTQLYNVMRTNLNVDIASLQPLTHR